MKIEFLHTKDCHVWKKALPVLENSVKELGIKEKISVVVIKTQRDAEKYRFFGSPAIRINGTDIDPMAKKAAICSTASCRPYFYRGKICEYPPKGMIVEAIKRYEQKISTRKLSRKTLKTPAFRQEMQAKALLLLHRKTLGVFLVKLNASRKQSFRMLQKTLFSVCLPDPILQHRKEHEFLPCRRTLGVLLANHRF